MPWLAALGAVGGGAAAAGGGAAAAGGAMGALGAAGAGAGLASAMGSGGGGALGALGSQGGGALGGMGNQLMESGVPMLGNMLGGQKKVKRKAKYKGLYEDNPYDWQSGEQETYQKSLDQALRNQRQQTYDQQQGYAENINRRGLGSSSIYGTGRAKIDQTGQNALMAQDTMLQEALQARRENRAANQRQLQHGWNVGVAVPAQQQQDQNDAIRQQAMMSQIAQNVSARQGPSRTYGLT